MSSFIIRNIDANLKGIHSAGQYVRHYWYFANCSAPFRLCSWHL